MYFSNVLNVSKLLCYIFYSKLLYNYIFVKISKSDTAFLRMFTEKQVPLCSAGLTPR